MTLVFIRGGGLVVKGFEIKAKTGPFGGVRAKKFHPTGAQVPKGLKGAVQLDHCGSPDN